MTDGFEKYRKTTPIHAVELPRSVTIETKEGTMEASAGDYLAIGAEGELYPIDAKIFRKTYERVEE